MVNKKGKVIGIGGIFFKSDQPEKLKKWYGEHLGLPIDEYGATFISTKENAPNQPVHMQWSVFPADTDYMKPSAKEFMINYRVEHIEALVDSLKSAGVTIVDAIEEYPYGKFVHILDPDGNKIELWEPPSGNSSK
ncbi:MAG: VOC family protein [Calditrichaeota bacterium]|nr:MAG: VOC family protein [Calditrichota bacterium]